MTVIDEQKGKNLGDSASQERTSSLALPGGQELSYELIFMSYLVVRACSILILFF